MRYTAILALGAVSLAGCKPEKVSENNSSSANGYDVSIEYYKKGSEAADLRIGTLRNESDPDAGFSEFILARDYDGDGKIDEIKIYAQKGSPLEDMASIKETTRILKEVKQRSN